MPLREPQAEMATAEQTARAAMLPWEDYAAGRCTLAQAEQRARAAGQGEAEIARAQELFAPIDAATQARFVAAIERVGEAVLVQPAAARWRRPALVAAAAGLLAASLVLWVNRGGHEATPTAPAMVAHELSITSVAEVRGDGEAGLASVPAGATLSFALRPATRHDVVPIVWACLLRDGEAVPLAVEQSSGAPGTTIAVRAALPGAVTAGTWELMAAVSSTAAPTDPQQACRVAPAPHVQVARQRFVVR